MVSYSVDRLLSWSFIADNRYLRNAYNALQKMLEDRATTMYFVILLAIIAMGLFGPMVTPYEYDERNYDENGDLIRSESPSGDHWLGTTSGGYDVFSRLVYGAQPTVYTGLLGGSIIITIGTLVGVTSGYVGGTVDSVLMRITDLFYGIPLIPFAIVLLAFFEIGFTVSILVIGSLLWRGSARVLRSQVLQIKERPFITSAKATGASTPRIMLTHILPNIASMCILFFALGVGYSIIVQAGLAFIGVSSPFIPSWGVMVRNAYSTGTMGDLWWWSIPPALMLSITVLSTFMFGRGYESIVGQSNEQIGEL